MTNSLLFVNTYIHSVSEPYANALHLDQGVVAWLGSTEAGQRMVAATSATPVDATDMTGLLITPAFIDGFSNREIEPSDARVTRSATVNTPDSVYYAALDQPSDDADGRYLAADQLDRLADVIAEIKPPTQLLIRSAGPEALTSILEILAQQPNAALLRSRHRILLNHEVSDEQIAQLIACHASVTVVPEIVDERPVFHAPIASLISQGVQVATGSGEWDGSMWEVLTAMIEHTQPAQRVSTRAAFNTVTRDGVRVWPSRIAQANMSAGQIIPGAPANLNIWHAEQLGVQAPDIQAAHWSTDKRAGTALLPILSSTEQAPRLEHIIRNGQMS